MTVTTISPLGVLDPPLARAEPARGVPIRIAGERVALHADGRRGLTASYTGSGLLTGPIRVTDAHAANIVHAPGVLRRELVTRAGTVWETWVTPERLAGFAVQWELVGAPGGAVELELEVDLAAAADRHDPWAVDGETLVVTAPGGGPAGVRLALSPRAAWSVEKATSGARARSVVALGPERPAVTLLVAERDAAGREPSLAALGGLDAHLRRAFARVADEPSGNGPGLRVRTGVAEIDEGVAWARQTIVDGRLPSPPGPATSPADAPDPLVASALEPGARRGWHALAALAAGEHEIAHGFLTDDPEHPLDALAWAAWVEWAAEPRRLAAARHGLDTALDRWARDPDPTTAAWVSFLRRRLADAAEGAGERAWADTLRAGAGPRGGTTARRLPTLPTLPTRQEPVDLLGALFGRTDERALPATAASLAIEGTPEPDTIEILAARTLYEAGRSDDAFTSLRRALGAPLRRGPSIDGVREAVTLWTFVTGLLGARPDAAFGRLRLRPRLPPHWSRLTVRGLSVGDATVDLAFEADGPVHRWRFSPVGGGLPAMLIFEPSFRLTPPLEVRIDDAPATLDEHVDGDRVTMRVQLPLDSERSIRVEGSRP